VITRQRLFRRPGLRAGGELGEAVLEAYRQALRCLAPAKSGIGELLKITCAATRWLYSLGAAPGGGEAFRSVRSGPPIHTATSRSAIGGSRRYALASSVRRRQGCHRQWEFGVGAHCLRNDRPGAARRDRCGGGAERGVIRKPQ
jgi:hypothetical protein